MAEHIPWISQQEGAKERVGATGHFERYSKGTFTRRMEEQGTGGWERGRWQDQSSGKEAAAVQGVGGKEAGAVQGDRGKEVGLLHQGLQIFPM